MTKTITTAKEYNARQMSMSAKFQNGDGSLKKVGYVATDGNVSQWFSTKPKAEQALAAGLDKTETSPTWDAMYNS